MKKLIITMVLTMTALMTASIASAQALDTPSEKSYYPTFLSLNGLTGNEHVEADNTNQTRGTKYNVNFEADRTNGK